MAEIRASDGEREAVAARLRTAAGDGRLDPDELEERLAVALAARTRGELAPLVADLPAVRGRGLARRASVVAKRPSAGRGGRSAAAYVAGNAALVGLWMADVGARDPWIVGDSDFFWPIVPMTVWALALLRRRDPRRRLA